MAGNEPPSDDLRDFDDTREFFEEELDLADKMVKAIRKRASKHAFKVAGVTQLRVANQVLDELKRAVDEGTTLEDFKAAVGDKLLEQWKGSVANPSARLETIFRTSTQTAYSAGRIRQLSEPDTLEVRPFWRFTAILDLRVSDICRACDGTVMPAKSAWWSTHQPPLHHRCRSTITSLTADQGEGKVSKTPPDATPDTGFGNVSEADLWVPDLSGIDASLRVVFRTKT